MDPAGSLLPHILDLLSRQPTLSADVEDLCKALEPLVTAQHIAPFGTLKKAVKFAMVVGIHLGIIWLSKERQRLPLNLRRTNALDMQAPKRRSARKAVKKTLALSRAKVTKARRQAIKALRKAFARGRAKAKRRAASSRARRQCQKRKPRVKRRR
ncbi:uncharacterized protein LOC117581708 [Drosophila guanche]|uniref:Uncharacterized protein n=1 Tax=Drosophila guanche TaxID=7266 RepID=A0A3B0K1S1_DROGU|nr:uncharacterized protein LOC117581708 [Drosophila guanche]SPP79546.1 Hypothetical predicted protein [Drosophila guanche]